jgi:hypothetical protein
MLKTLPWRMTAFGCALGALAGLLVVTFETDFPAQICEYNQATRHEECATYHIVFVALWHIAKILNDYGPAISAAATVAIAAFTWTLWLATTEQGRFTQQSIDLARKEFISTHRPKLAVRYVYLNSRDPINGMENAEKLEVNFTVENIGGSDATVTQSMIGLHCYEAPLPCPPEFYKFGRDILKGATFSTGATQGFTASNDVEISVSTEMYFIGWAEYVDAAGSTRALRFCREYEVHTNRFSVVIDPEYEPKDDY